MKPNYCLPIIKTKKIQVLEMLKRSKEYQYFEIWADYIEDLDYDFINSLKLDYRGKLIFVFRRQNLETPVMETQKRLSIISSLENSDSFVDLDVVTQQEELSYIQNNNLQLSLITSYHNYQQTPEDKKISDIISIMMNYNPNIIKVATNCITPKDALRLLDLLLQLKTEKKKCIILGMGEYGTITRVYGALWGNEITFAPDKETESSAPGQLTKTELETIYKILNTKY